LVDPLETGKVAIDKIDISTIGLHDLRLRLAVIPQDPCLFKGTLRSNLDPFGQYPDSELWAAIDAVHLRGQVDGMEGGLEAKVAEYGENLSVGTRQILCLARALLKKPKILILDEATASVDYANDQLIQTTIRDQFKESTVLTIAHRIETIMDYDRIMVLDAGELKEFDTPEQLLQNPNSLFTKLAKAGKQSNNQ
jgi:ATP-binding cassette, subfamily C (CFTR/MRP), member 1